MSAQLPEDARKPAPDENGGDASALIGALRDATTAGRPREATALAGAVADLAGALGPEDHRVLGARFHLARAYRAAGDPASAVALLEQVVAGTERLLGPDALQALTARGALASACADAGEARRAVGLYERIVDDAAHPHLALFRRNLERIRPPEEGR